MDPWPRRVARLSSADAVPSRFLDPRHWWDVALAADPDLGRWRVAWRTVLAIGLASVVLGGLAHLTHWPMLPLLVGVMIAMNAVLQVGEPTPANGPVTMLWLVVPAACCIVLGSVLAHVVWLDALAYLAVIFTAVYLRRFGPRGTAFGMVAFISYFFALYFQAGLGVLPLMVLSVAVGVLCAFVVRFWLLPERGTQILRWAARVFPHAVMAALASLADAAAAPAYEQACRRAIRRALQRVNLVALAIDHQDGCAALLAPNLGADELRTRVFGVELALDRLATSVMTHPPDPLWVRALRDAREALRAGRPLPDAARAIAPLGDRLAEVFAAARALGAPGTQGWPAVTAPPPEPAAAPGAPGFAPFTRQAIQVTLATAIAMAVGWAISPQRWLWAVLGAFLMYVRATTRGEVLLRGWYRVLGTMGGALAAIVLAEGIHGHPAVELSVIFASIFVGFYLLRVAYAYLAFAITLMLAGLYSLMGRYSPGLMGLRVVLTLVGCVIGGAVAAWVMPAPTSPKLRETAITLLRELAALVEAALGGESRPRVLARARQLDRSVQALRDTSKPLTGALFGFVQPARQEEVHLLATAAFFARHLALSGEPGGALRAEAHEVAGHARAIADALERGEPIPCAALVRPRQAAEPVPQTIVWLAHVDDALVMFGQPRATNPPERP